MASRKGKPNVKKQAFRDRLQTYCTRFKADPHFWMVRQLSDSRVPIAIRMECATQLAQYLQPKLRSVQLTGDADNPLRHLHELPQDQLDARITRLLRDCGYAGDHEGLPEEPPA